MNNSIHQITALEDLANRDTPLNRIEPQIKLILCFIYIIVVISFEPDNVSGLVIFILFPFFFMLLGDIPFRILFTRCAAALPFAFFAGVTNLFFNREIAFHIGKIDITEGMLTFTSLMLKTILTVMAVLLLVAATSMNDLIYTLISLHLPSLFVIQIMMTYRYLQVLLSEANLMYHAYQLRAPRQKGIKMKDMGSFLGQLILRSIDRAERIYHAMKCRGFEGRINVSSKISFGLQGWLIIFIAGILFIIFRIYPIVKIIGSLIVG